MKTLLKVKNLHVRVDDKEILRGLDLTIQAGETHAIMGPNGSGKSTLAHVLAGKSGYEIVKGDMLFDDVSLADMSPESRAHAGLFLAFQYPMEIAGVTNMTFLKTAVNAMRVGRGEAELDAASFLRMAREQAKNLGMNDDMLKRELNVGFSGGEKKRNEILQMAMLQPRLAILDESDSGLDIDALKIVAEGVNNLRSPDRALLVITHYQRLLDFIKPDHVHVMADGRIARSGDAALALQLEKSGYGDYQTDSGVGDSGEGDSAHA